MNADEADLRPMSMWRSASGTKTPSNALRVGWKGMLRDGTQVVVRPIRADDRELGRSFIERMLPAARRFRFLDTMKSPSPALLTHLTAIDPATDVTFMALLANSEAATEIGVARFSARADGSDCEFAIAVGEAWQRKGLGTLLMHRLIHAAQQRGISWQCTPSAPPTTARWGACRAPGPAANARDPERRVHRWFIASHCHCIRKRLFEDGAFGCATAQTGEIVAAHTGLHFDQGAASFAPLAFA